MHLPACLDRGAWTAEYLPSLKSETQLTLRAENNDCAITAVHVMGTHFDWQLEFTVG